MILFHNPGIVDAMRERQLRAKIKNKALFSYSVNKDEKSKKGKGSTLKENRKHDDKKNRAMMIQQRTLLPIANKVTDR